MSVKIHCRNFGKEIHHVDISGRLMTFRYGIHTCSNSEEADDLIQTLRKSGYDVVLHQEPAPVAEVAPEPPAPEVDKVEALVDKIEDLVEEFVEAKSKPPATPKKTFKKKNARKKK